MKAVGYMQSLPVSDPEALLDIELPMPEFGKDDLLVAVHAIAVNPVDYKIRHSAQPEQGTYRILGWDAVGIVKAMGDNVTGFAIGDEVYYAGAINRSGANQQIHAVDARIVAHKPKSLTNIEAAALPLTALTAYETLFDRLKVNDAVAGAEAAILIIGGAGGVGSITIQLVKQLTDLKVIATASRPESAEWVKKMGADYVIDHTQPLTAQVNALNIGAPAFVFSTTHTETYLDDIVNLIAPQGRIALIDDPKMLDIMPLKVKSLSIHWELMFTRSLFTTKDMARQQEILATVAKLVDEKRILTTQQQSFSPINAEHLRQAHEIIESGAAIGKIVLADW